MTVQWNKSKCGKGEFIAPAGLISVCFGIGVGGVGLR